MKIRTALQEPGPLKRPNVLRKKNRIAHSLEERRAVTFFGRETGRHIFRKKDETKHSPEEGKDPVALDQACVDLVYQAEGNDALVDRIEQLHGIHTLEHAEETGLRSRTYELVNIDE